MTDVFEVDGARGEGGGQVLRTSLALSLATGRAVRLKRIRAGRPKPGLLRQHLTALRAAAAVSCGRVTGDELGSSEVLFAPGPVRPGDYHFAVGSAGSTTLVLQTVLLPLALCGGSSRLRIEGGTHNRSAPPFGFLAHSYLPLLRGMGLDVEAHLVRAGYEPAGGGELEVRIGAPGTLRPLELGERGELGERRAEVRIAHLSRRIAEEERATLVRLLRLGSESIEIVVDEDSPGPGNVVTAFLRLGERVHAFTSFGQAGRPARRVATLAAQQLRRFLGSRATVDVHLADQVLLPMALTRGGRIQVDAPSSHTATNLGLLADWGFPFEHDEVAGTVTRADGGPRR